MNRRRFLRVLGAVSAGVALKAVPIAGEQMSELVAPTAYTAGVPTDYTLTMADFNRAIETLRANHIPGPYELRIGPNQLYDLRNDADFLPLGQYSAVGWKNVEVYRMDIGPCNTPEGRAMMAELAREMAGV